MCAINMPSNSKGNPHMFFLIPYPPHHTCWFVYGIKSAAILPNYFNSFLITSSNLAFFIFAQDV